MIRTVRLGTGALLAAGLFAAVTVAKAHAPVESECLGVTNTDALGGLSWFTYLDPLPGACRIVDAVNDHPVHDGTQSVRFELPAGYCNSGPAVPDCQTDRSRYSIFHTNPGFPSDGKTVTYEEWVYVPPQTRFRPRGTNILFLTQLNYYPPNNDAGGVLAYLEVGEDGELMIRTHLGFNFDIRQRYPVLQNPVGVWTKVLWEVGASTQSNGFLRVYINDVLMVDETKPTMPAAGWRHSLNIGLYNAFVSGATEPFATQLVYFDGIKRTESAFNPSLIQNGDFSGGEQFWQFFATPTPAYIVHQVTNERLSYYRVPPPPGTSNQAVAYQETGAALPAGAPILAQFNLANTSTVRKRVSVLVLDGDFSDLTVCTFWLAPNAPMRTYRIRAQTTEAWTNAALYFYAASAGSDGGYIQIDNASMTYMPQQTVDHTDCVDPTAPAPAVGSAGPDLLVNGNFDTGVPAPWFTFGTIASQITNGVFEFIRPSSVLPAGVVAQSTGQAMTAGQILTASFRLGNSSSARKRVTVLVHDSDFSDLSACSFWLEAGQPLSPYTYRTFATKAWVNAMVSVYPATVGVEPWILLDDVTLQRTPGTATAGTECIAPPASAPAPPGTAWEMIGTTPGSLVRQLPQAIDLGSATSAHLIFESARPRGLHASHGLLQVSVAGGPWATVQETPPFAEWTAVDLDLSAFTGQIIRVRFVLESTRSASATPEVWRVRSLQLVIR